MGWSEWNREYRGTHWDVIDATIFQQNGAVEIIFATAWSPPEDWFKFMIAKYPHLCCIIAFHEQNAAFYGFYKSNASYNKITNQVYCRITGDDYVEDEFDDYQPAGKYAEFLEKYGLQY